jgi:hypothetical protein
LLVELSLTQRATVRHDVGRYRAVEHPTKCEEQWTEEVRIIRKASACHPGHVIEVSRRTPVQQRQDFAGQDLFRPGEHRGTRNIGIGRPSVTFDSRYERNTMQEIDVELNVVIRAQSIPIPEVDLPARVLVAPHCNR